MKVLKDIERIMKRQLNEIAMKNDITPQELEYVGEAVDVIKDIATICAMWKYDEENSYAMMNGNSNSYPMPMYMYADGSYGYNNMHMPSFNMAGNRGENNPINHSGNNSMNYSNGRSYDEQKKVMMRTLEDIMHKATSENDRMAIQNCIEKLRMD